MDFDGGMDVRDVSRAEAIELGLWTEQARNICNATSTNSRSV
jgi:hypothetical protein